MHLGEAEAPHVAAIAAADYPEDIAPRGEGAGANRVQRDPYVAPRPVHHEGERRRGERRRGEGAGDSADTSGRLGQGDHTDLCNEHIQLIVVG